MSPEPTGPGPRRPASRRRWSAPVRLLTPLGRGVLASGVVTLVVALWLNWQEFVQIGVVALGLVLIGFAWQVLPGVPTTRVVLHVNRVTEGATPPSATIHVQAGSAPMLFPRLTVPVGPRRVHLRLPFLAPFAHHAETIELPAVPRGVHQVGPVSYDKADPVGLVARRIVTGPATELFVTPRVSDLPLFAGGLTNDLDGATSQQLSMSDLAFHALREYVPGDDLRHVHWRSSAKAGELLVRQYHETRRGQVTILLDDHGTSYPRPRDFELAVSIAASIALRAVRDDFDTYLRCGPHLARGRSAAGVTDASCRFVVGEHDGSVVQAAEAAATVGVTGLVVQVTGAQRDEVGLDAAAGQFGQVPDRLVVRADSSSTARVADTARLREVVVPDLSLLHDVMARSLR